MYHLIRWGLVVVSVVGVATPVFAASATRQAQVLIVIPERRDLSTTGQPAFPAARQADATPADGHVMISEMRDAHNQPFLLYTYTPAN